MMFHFYTTFLNLFNNISSLFSSRTIVSSTGSCFTILSSFNLVTASEILFLKIHLPFGLLSWKQLLKNLFLYPIIVFYIFLQIIKNHFLLVLYPITILFNPIRFFWVAGGGGVGRGGFCVL